MSQSSPQRPRRTPSKGAPPGPGRSPAAQAAAGIDPIQVIRRHMLSLVASLFIGGGMGTAAYFLLAKFFPLYRATVIFEVQAGVGDAGEVATNQQIDEDDVERIGRTELVLLTSREVLEDAMKEPDVQKTEWLKTFIDESGIPNIQEAVDELEEDLGTTLLRGTELFQASFSTHRREDPPVILNAIADAYMREREQIDMAAFQDNLMHFNAQLSETNADISDLDSEISQFITEAGITSLDDPRYSQTAATVNTLVGQVTQAQENLNLVVTLYEQAVAKLQGTISYSPEDILEAEQDFSVMGHIQQIETLKVEIRVLEEHYTSRQHPLLRRVHSQLRASESERKAKTEEVITRNLNAKIKIYVDQGEQYENLIRDLQIELESQGLALQELASETAIYDTLVSRRNYLEQNREGDRIMIRELNMMRLRKDSKQTRIYQRALTPRELYFPRLEIMLPMFVFLTSGLVVGIIFLREMMDKRIRSARDIVGIPNTSLLGVIPELEEDPTGCDDIDLIVCTHPLSVVAESYRQALPPLLKALEEGTYQSLVLMSGLPGSGTTAVAGNLAASIASTDRSVLLVDANFRRPRCAAMLGMDPDGMGLGDLLLQGIQPQQVIQPTDAGFDLLSAGTPASRLIERLNTDQLEHLIAQQCSEYDLVLLDAPPAVVASDALTIAGKVDASILVVRANQDQRGLVRRIIRQLSEASCDLVGVVLNRPLMTAGGYFKKNYASIAEYAKVDDRAA